MEQVKLTNEQASGLGKLFVEVAMFASTDQARPILAAVRMDRDDDGRMRMVATDSYKLGVFTATNVEVPEGFSSLVDARDLTAAGKDLAKLKSRSYSDDEVKVVLSFGESALLVEADGWSRTAAVVDAYGADYPNWKQVIPTETSEGVPSLAPFHLATFAKVRLGEKPASQAHSLALTMTSFGNLKPVTFESSSDIGTFFGLLMPVKK